MDATAVATANIVAATHYLDCACWDVHHSSTEYHGVPDMTTNQNTLA
jgi:hypothetical protein